MQYSDRAQVRSKPDEKTGFFIKKLLIKPSKNLRYNKHFRCVGALLALLSSIIFYTASADAQDGTETLDRFPVENQDAPAQDLVSQEAASANVRGVIEQQIQFEVFIALRATLLILFDPTPQDVVDNQYGTPSTRDHQNFDVILDALWSSHSDLKAGRASPSSSDNSALKLWLARYEARLKEYRERTATALTALPRINNPIARARLTDRIGDAYAESIAKLVQDRRVSSTDLTSILGNFLMQTEAPSLVNFSDIRPTLEGFGIWKEVRTELRIISMRILAAIRSPYAYYWLARVVGEVNADGVDTPESLEACRLLSHNDRYAALNDDINGAEAVSYFTFEMWLGIRFALNIRKPETTPEQAQLDQNQYVKLVLFSRRLEAAVLNNRRSRNLRVPHVADLNSIDELGQNNGALDSAVTEMRRTLHSETSVDRGKLTDFIAQHERHDLYYTISGRFAPKSEEPGRAQRYLSYLTGILMRCAWVFL